MQLNLLVLRTNQPEILAEFYGNLGLKFEYHRHGKSPFHYSAKINEMVFEIYPFQKGQTEVDTSLRLGFLVKDLNTLIHNLKDQKTEIVQAPRLTEWGYCAIIKDTDGRKIELTEK